MKLRASLQTCGSRQKLVVVVPGWVHGSERLGDVVETVRGCLPDADILILDYPNGRFSNANPHEIAVAMLDEVDGAVVARAATGGYRGIILIGYSMGSLLARKLYVYARGMTQDAPGLQGSAPKPWAHAVERIVLFAGMNRGWSLAPKPEHMSHLACLRNRLLIRVVKTVGVARMIRSLERGSPFVVNLRLQWMDLAAGYRLADHDATVGMPETIQLLGTIDDLVSAKDSRDLQYHPDFIYRRLANANHVNIVDFAGNDGQARRSVVIEALTAAKGKIPTDFPPARERDDEVEDVVMVMSGIRDRGFWTDGVADAVAAEGRRLGRKTVSVRSGYGYFAMLPFLLLKSRQRNVRWLMDEYVEAKSKWPKARFHYIGHSNGTYLLASALEQYRAAHVDHVVFAGSVVRCDYPWRQRVLDGQVRKAVNYVASNDVVVSTFPGFLERFGQDVGSAGHNGFDADEARDLNFIAGGHGAAIRAECFADMAAFVLSGTTPTSGLIVRRSGLAEWSGRLNWLVWIALLSTVVALGWVIMHHAGLSWLALYVALLITLLCTV